MENDSSCATVDLSELPTWHTIFDIHIRCQVLLLKFSLTGAECSNTITYGPYIGGLQIVERFIYNGQPCHTPFISTVKKDGKCLVTVDYAHESEKSAVHLQVKLIRSLNVVTVTFCKQDLHYTCV